jgi:hypothetical protein
MYNYTTTIDIGEVDEEHCCLVLVYHEVPLMEEEVKMSYSFTELEVDSREFPTQTPLTWKRVLRLPADSNLDESSIGRQDHQTSTGGLLELVIARKKRVSISKLRAPRFSFLTTTVKTPIQAPEEEDQDQEGQAESAEESEETERQ